MKITERVLKDLIEEQGGRIISLQSNNHWKAKCSFGTKIITVIAPKTPSDLRAILNWKSWLKKKVKQDGI